MFAASLTARDKAYLEYVRSQPCISCLRDAPNDPHHFGLHGVGIKTDDYRTVPLCRECHRGWHAQGKFPLHTAVASRLIMLKAQVDLLVRWVHGAKAH